MRTSRLITATPSWFQGVHGNSRTRVGLLTHGMRVAALACLAFFGLASARPLDAANITPEERDAFLRAIAEVETGNNPRRVGRLGERGPYQFRLATWRQHTSRPFREAHSPTVAYVVASRHYEWIMRTLERQGRRATPYLIAAAWNGGVTRVSSGRIPAASRDYAQRVVNLASMWSPRIRAAELPHRPLTVAAN